MAELRIRQMAAADVDAAVNLALAQGWRNRLRFYDFVLRVPTVQAVVGEFDGRIVATGVAVANGPVGWLSGIVVDAAWRGRGFGRAMTQSCIERLQDAGCRTLSLEATDVGRPLYERMGFRLAAHYRQLQADRLDEPPPVPSDARIRKLELSDLPAVFELDRQASGEDRAASLEVLASIDWSEGRVLERDGRLAGYLMTAERAYGPIVAPRFEDGLYLLDLHRSLVGPGQTVRAGVPEEHTAGWRELLARGWAETWRAPRLLLGPDVAWRPRWIWGQINSGMG